MCLEVFAVPGELGRISAERLSAISGLLVSTRHRPVMNSLHFSREAGCSCSLLSETADFEEATWAFAPEVLEGIAEALSAIHSEAGGFTFQAAWIGDSPETEEIVPLKQVLRDVRANKIRNRHVYKTGRAHKERAA